MKHKITTTKTEDGVQTVMECEFEDAAIAELIDLERAMAQWERQDSASESLRLTAKKDDKTLTFRVHQSAGLPLQEIASVLEEQEAQYLPAMRYFNSRAKRFNENMREWRNELNQRLNGLEYDVKQIHRWKDAADKEMCDMARKIQDLKWQLNNHSDKVGELDEEVTALEKLYEGLRGMFIKHAEQRFHFHREKRSRGGNK